MMVNWEVILTILGVWNIALSYLLWRLAREFQKVSQGIDKENLKEILNGLEKARKKLKQLEEENKFCFQKASLVKFNPFSELGGDQSFSLALLDDKDQGIVITSLHGRQATRIYTKLIGDDKVKLSEEEKKAIKQASKNKK
jgi:hypothetical protein